jgi:hypothetical protein|tara:strand:+ start:62 stop:400 length:339 start_codon:yes stop_codon:yes gene_type:complete
MSDRKIMDNKQLDTRLNYDEAATLRKIKEDLYYSNYMLESVTTNHTSKALHTFGLIGGPVNNDSYTNIIDLESKLLGIHTKTKYNSNERVLDTTKQNKLNDFQLIDFKETII